MQNNVLTIVTNDAYYPCSTKFNQVVITNSVRELPTDAFRNCRKLERVDIYSTDIIIHPNCFKDCKSLKTVVFHNINNVGHYEIRQCCFDGCISLEEISLPYGLKNLELYCFADCTSLKQINLPNSLESLGEYCFMVVLPF